MNLAIRHARPEDAQALAEVHVAAWKAAYAGLLPDAYLGSLAPGQKLKRWQERFHEAQTLILVAEDEGRLLGFCFGGACRDADSDPTLCAEIQAIYLLREHWGKGAGRALLERAMAELRGRGFCEAVLWVLRGNLRACRFYERGGFVLDGAAKLKSKGQGITLDEVRYRRPLG